MNIHETVNSSKRSTPYYIPIESNEESINPENDENSNSDVSFESSKKFDFRLLFFSIALGISILVLLYCIYRYTTECKNDKQCLFVLV